MRIRPLWRGLAIATGLAVSTVFTYLAVRDVDWGNFTDALSDS